MFFLYAVTLPAAACSSKLSLLTPMGIDLLKLIFIFFCINPNSSRSALFCSNGTNRLGLIQVAEWIISCARNGFYLFDHNYTSGSREHSAPVCAWPRDLVEIIIKKCIIWGSQAVNEANCCARRDDEWSSDQKKSLINCTITYRG